MNGKELKKLRLHYNITQRKLADSTGIPEGTISRWESKEVDISKMKDVLAIETFFGKLSEQNIGEIIVNEGDLNSQPVNIEPQPSLLKKIEELSAENNLLKEQLLKYQAKEIEELKKQLAEKDKAPGSEQRSVG